MSANCVMEAISPALPGFSVVSAAASRHLSDQGIVRGRREWGEGGLTAGVAFEPVDFVLAEPERVVRLVPELPRRAAAVQRAAVAVCSASSISSGPSAGRESGKGRGWGRTEAELEAEAVDVCDGVVEPGRVEMRIWHQIAGGRAVERVPVRVLTSRSQPAK